MKVKVGFITNSSSSSFIVAWAMKIKSINDVARFIDRKDHVDVVYADALKHRASKIGERNHKRLLREVVESMDDGYIYGVYESTHKAEERFLRENNITKDELLSNNEIYRLFYRDLDLRRSRKNAVIADKFLKDNYGSYLYRFSYADEDGEFFASMEHGQIFYKLPHITISHH